VAQIMLSWLWTQNIVILPKTSKKEHLFDNMMISHILLDEEDLLLIDGFPKNFRYCNPDQIAPERD
jgi:diketogulonate reductase-like aldo/keto reductase